MTFLLLTLLLSLLVALLALATAAPRLMSAGEAMLVVAGVRFSANPPVRKRLRARRFALF